MKSVVFVTGNASKAKYLSELLGLPISHAKIEVDEIQSLDLMEVVRHKAVQAYAKWQGGPVLVEDVALEFAAFGRLPGTLIRWFLEELSLEEICRLLDGKDRTAIARCVFGYYDGKEVVCFEGVLPGRIAESPGGDRGFGWDKIFIPERYDVTRASLNEEDDRETYLRLKRIDDLRTFLTDAGT